MMGWLDEITRRLRGAEGPEPAEPPPVPGPRFPDAKGRSVRHAAFSLFDEGYRPSEIRDRFPVKPETLYRYFQSWKHRERVERDRLLFEMAQQHPDTARHIAEVKGLPVAKVVEALRASNPRGALNAAHRQELQDIVEAAEEGAPVDAVRAARLFSHYVLVDRAVLRRRLRRALGDHPEATSSP